VPGPGRGRAGGRTASPGAGQRERRTRNAEACALAQWLARGHCLDADATAWGDALKRAECWPLL